MMARTTEHMLAERASQTEISDQRKKEEFRTWLFLALIMAPVLAVLIVSGFGFAVWFYQLIAGPPS
jgi:periplasmic nitrate reductase NapE